MRRRVTQLFAADDSGAISPLYSLVLVALVALAGIGFDYGRLMALDTELQNAADQAALAAVTQLDGQPGAIDRAKDAARNYFANQTRIANDNDADGLNVTIPDAGFVFYDGHSGDTLGNVVDQTDADADADAKVVQVTVEARKVFYALTPIVGALNSGDVIGRAVAALDEATCNVAPLFFCVPNDGLGDPIRTFPDASNVGEGLELHFKQNVTGNADDAGTNWAPGNFGFLDVPWGTQSDSTRKLGLNTAAAGCFGGGVASRTGFKDPEGDALNTRLDLYNPPIQPNSCDGAGNFCPAENVRKGWVRKESYKKKYDQLAGLDCDPGHKGTWMSGTDAAAEADTFSDPGYPTDDCFATGGCTVNGDGVWDPSGTWMSSALGYGVGAVPDLDGNGKITRWEVYQYELGNPSAPKIVGTKGFPASPPANPSTQYDVSLYCSYPQPIQNAPVVANDAQKDRRLLTTAAVDCTELNGKKVVDILQWVDLFLVRAVYTKGSDKVFFTEIKGPGEKPSGESGFQYFGRKKAVLIR